jgi:hypothetical protein
MKEESFTRSLRPHQQPDDPLHGVTLEMILKELVAQYGWEKLGKEVPLRCFADDFVQSEVLASHAVGAGQGRSALYLVPNEVSGR